MVIILVIDKVIAIVYDDGKYENVCDINYYNFEYYIHL